LCSESCTSDQQISAIPLIYFLTLDDSRPEDLTAEGLEHTVSDTSVHDRHRADAAHHRVHSVLELRDHATGDGSIASERGERGGGDGLDELLVLVENTLDVREEQQSIGLKRFIEKTKWQEMLPMRNNLRN
jgi:hypothetical protein